MLPGSPTTRPMAPSDVMISRSGALAVLAVVILQVVVYRLVTGRATSVGAIDLALTRACHRGCLSLLAGCLVSTPGKNLLPHGHLPRK